MCVFLVLQIAIKIKQTRKNLKKIFKWKKLKSRLQKTVRAMKLENEKIKKKAKISTD